MKVVEIETYSNQRLWLEFITLRDQLAGFKKMKKDLPDYLSDLLPQVERNISYVLVQINKITDQMNFRGI